MAAQPYAPGETLENTRPRTHEDSEIEHDRVRTSNDRDQELEREGRRSKHNQGYDDAVRGEQNAAEDIDVVRGGLRGEDIGDVDEQALDPDSASSQNDRDDTTDE